MIFADGTIYPSEEQDKILLSLEEKINRTRERSRLPMEKVIRAFDRLCHEIADGKWNDLLKKLTPQIPASVIDSVLPRMEQKGLEYKVKIELGEEYFQDQRMESPFDGKALLSRAVPLGTLFHIAAGNMEALPAYSIAEGLLTGSNME